MTVATFTMEDVVNGVLREMRYAPGRDVQIHLQDSIVQDASMFYRAMMKRFIWRDWYYMDVVTTNSSGIPTAPPPNIDRYTNLLAVYKEKSSLSLPFLPALANPLQYNQTVVAPNAATVWRVYPGMAGTFVQWARNYTDADFELTDTVPFYKDILIIGTAVSLATKSGINKELVALLREQLTELIDMYRMDEIKSSYTVHPAQGAVPTEWYSYDN